MRIVIYNLLGQEVAVLVNAEQPVGWYNIAWDGRDRYGQPASSGVYLYQLQTLDVVRTRKMMLLK